MRMNLAALPPLPNKYRPPRFPYSFAAGGDPEDIDDVPEGIQRKSARKEDLPYKVELWDTSRSTVEQVLAVTANGSIGYAAFYAATREYPDRYITLRQKNRVISRWNGPEH